MAKFTFLGGMCVLIERKDGYRILCDPYLSQNPNIKVADYYDVDLILVTHAAFDHYGDLDELMTHNKAVLMAGGDVRRMLTKATGINAKERLLKIVYGDRRQFGVTTVRPVYAMHVSASNPEGVHVTGNPYGFIVQVEPGICYYHAGDTFLFSDMKLLRSLYHPNIMTVGISSMGPGYPCEMTELEAAMAVSFVGPQVVIPSHYAEGSNALQEFERCISVLSSDTIIKSDIGKPFIYEPFCCHDDLDEPGNQVEL